MAHLRKQDDVDARLQPTTELIEEHYTVAHVQNCKKSQQLLPSSSRNHTSSQHHKMTDSLPLPTECRPSRNGTSKCPMQVLISSPGKVSELVIICHKPGADSNNQCRNNNKQTTSSLRTCRPEYPYDGPMKSDKSCGANIRKSRLIICALVFIILGLGVGLVYFLLNGEPENKASDPPLKEPSIRTEQTLICGNMPSTPLSSNLRDDTRPEGTQSTTAAMIENVPGSARPKTQATTPGDFAGQRPVQARIFGGRSVTILRFPWQASLWLKDLGMQCGGALIMPNWVVTAAHCTERTNASAWTVYLGMSQLSTKHLMPAQTVKVERIFAFPEYQKTWWNYVDDVSLLKLTESVWYSAYVQPICLPQPYEKFGNESTCSISGWGSTLNNGVQNSPNYLQSGEVDIIPKKICDREDWLGPFVLTDRMICAGKADGSVDACAGDSGGPLSCYDEKRDVWTLAGVVSFGKGCGNARKPGVYAKVSVFTEWIWKTIGENG